MLGGFLRSVNFVYELRRIEEITFTYGPALLGDFATRKHVHELGYTISIALAASARKDPWDPWEHCEHAS